MVAMNLLTDAYRHFIILVYSLRKPHGEIFISVNMTQNKKNYTKTNKRFMWL